MGSRRDRDPVEDSPEESWRKTRLMPTWREVDRRCKYGNLNRLLSTVCTPSKTMKIQKGKAISSKRVSHNLLLSWKLTYYDPSLRLLVLSPLIICFFLLDILSHSLLGVLGPLSEFIQFLKQFLHPLRLEFRRDLNQEFI